MADQYKDSIASELYIEPLATVTLTAGPDTLKTINLETFGQLHSVVAVLRNCTFAGATTLIWYGGTTTSGGTLTQIAKLTLTSAHTKAVLQIDVEDICTAAEEAGLMPEGFKSLVLRIDGANSDAIRGCIVVKPMHKYNMLTPSDVVALSA